MRNAIAALAAVSFLGWSGIALAQDVAAPDTGSAPPSTQTTVTTPATTTTTSVTPAPTGTTTTTQAAVDTNVTTPVTPPPPSESGASQSTTYVNRPLLATGLVLFGGSYIPAIAVGAESNRPSDNPNLYIPVVGPWLDLGQRDCSVGRPCVNETGNKTLLIVDGAAQGLGALAVITSLFIPEKKSRHWFFIGSEKLHPEPTMVGGGYGLAAAGKF
jgi:hypothetical protein